MNKKELVLMIYGIGIVMWFLITLIFFAKRPEIVALSINGRTHPDLYMYKTYGDFPIVGFVFTILMIPIIIANSLLQEKSSSLD